MIIRGRPDHDGVRLDGEHLRIGEGKRIVSLDPGRSTSIVHAERGQKEKHMGILVWIVVGLIAGWLAGQVMKGGGYGLVADIILGLLGGVLGGWIFEKLGVSTGDGMVGSIIVAFIGAVILVGITRLLKRA